MPFIDWNPLFSVWQLRGRYPNRGYPKIFNDDAVGAEAMKLYDDAVALMQHFIDNKLLSARAVVGIYPANSVGDDIEVYADENRTEPVETFYTLRQQEEREDDAYLALSDFVAPKGSGVKDYVGAFAVSCGFGSHELCEKYKAEHNDYNVIMTEAIADRFAEAFAELLHAKMRKELWAYAPDEDITPDDMLKVKYQGIRPAPGYPTQPDHTEKPTMWRLLDAHKATGIELTDSHAMLPASSVSAVVLANPCAQYFQVRLTPRCAPPLAAPRRTRLALAAHAPAPRLPRLAAEQVGRVCKDQVTDYAERKGMGVKEVEKWLGPYLAYDDNA